MTVNGIKVQHKLWKSLSAGTFQLGFKCAAGEIKAVRTPVHTEHSQKVLMYSPEKPVMHLS
jgi:hypothetical protein